MTLTVQTLTAFLVATLSKKFTNPSSEIIGLLAGLDQADATLTEVAADLDTKIRHGESCAWLIPSKDSTYRPR